MSQPNLKIISNREFEPMKKSNGFVLQHQSIDNQSWSDDPFCMLVVQFLIRKASYKPHSIQYGKHLIDLNVGQYATTNLKLAKSSAVYGLYKSSKNPDEAAKSAVKTTLKTLEADGFLSKHVIGKGKDQCTVITIKNWAKFQAKNVSVLKPITKPLAEPQEKPIQTHASSGYQGDAKPIKKPIVEPIANPNNNKGYKQQDIKEYDGQAHNTLLNSAYEHIWKKWKSCKKSIGKTDTSAKGETFSKNFKSIFNKSYFAKKSEPEFKAEINSICAFMVKAHGVEGFNRFENMQLAKFLNQKQWRD